jgi:hypothetical protein
MGTSIVFPVRLSVTCNQHMPQISRIASLKPTSKTNGTITVKLWFEDPFAISVRISSVVRGEGVVVGGVDSLREGNPFCRGHFRSRARLKSGCSAERGRPLLRKFGVEACDSRCDWLLARKYFCRIDRRGTYPSRIIFASEVQSSKGKKMGGGGSGSRSVGRDTMSMMCASGNK